MSCLASQVRWKPPPPRTNPSDPHIGWRTEFRSMEIQLTDFENAAFTVFVILLTRIILTFDLTLYVPLSKVRGPPWAEVTAGQILCWRSDHSGGCRH